MKTFCIILLLSVCTVSLYSRDEVRVADSILNEIYAMPCDSNRLNKIIEIAKMKLATDEFEFYTLLFYKEAVSQQNVAKIYMAHYYRIVSDFNQGKYDSIPAIWSRMKPIARRLNDFGYYFSASRMLIESYYLQEQFERAVDAGIKIKEDAVALGNTEGTIAANMGIATVYISVNRLNESAALLKEALALNNDFDTELDVLLRLVWVYDLQKSPELLTILNRMNSLFEDVDKPNRKEYFDLYGLYLMTMYGNYYLNAGDVAMADKYYERGLNALHANSYYLYRHYFHVFASSLFERKKDFTRAVSENKAAMKIIEELHPTDYIGRVYNEARLLALNNETARAVPLFEYAFNKKDSIRKDFSKSQVNQILSNYYLDKALYQQKRYEKKSAILMLITILVVLLIISCYLYKYALLKKELRESALKTEEARCRIEEACREKTMFMRNICHDIRSSLTSIVGFSELISEDGHLLPDTEKKRFQKIIETNSSELSLLINNILELSRHEVGKILFKKEEFDFGEMLSQSFAHIPLDNKLTVPVCIRADRDYFSQVLASLFNTENIQAMAAHHMLLQLTEDNQAELRIYGSEFCRELANLLHFTRNEINQCVIKRQGGVYDILTDASGNPFIVIRMPII